VRKWKWGTRPILLAMTLVMALIVSACGGNEKTEEEKLAEAVQEVLKDAQLNGEALAGEEEPSVKNQLTGIGNFVTSELWNDGFVNIGFYASRGTGATGETLDIAFTIERLGKAIEQKAEHDAYIQGLAAEYDGIKDVWSKLSSEADKLYQQLEATPPAANDSSYAFDTGLFQQYSDAFRDDVAALNE